MVHEDPGKGETIAPARNWIPPPIREGAPDDEATEALSSTGESYIDDCRAPKAPPMFFARWCTAIVRTSRCTPVLPGSSGGAALEGEKVNPLPYPAVQTRWRGEGREGGRGGERE